jgi:hypothetical protein
LEKPNNLNVIVNNKTKGLKLISKIV